MTELRGQVAVVTGATKGIGRAIAESLAKSGVHVVLAARREQEVRAAEAALSRDTRALGVVCDVRKHEDCERLIAQAVAEFGRLDVLVNNAGIGRFGAVAELSVADWHAVIETNLNSLFY